MTPRAGFRGNSPIILYPPPSKVLIFSYLHTLVDACEMAKENKKEKEKKKVYEEKIYLKKVLKDLFI